VKKRSNNSVQNVDPITRSYVEFSVREEFGLRDEFMGLKCRNPTSARKATAEVGLGLVGTLL
jgi:hypothetical protein